MKILYVCTGNICRSPLGEGITRHLAREMGLDITTASAGTHGYHVGEPPDRRSSEVARRHGVSLQGQKARAVSLNDFDDFDLILAMDRGHLRHLEAMAPSGSRAKVALFMAHTMETDEDVPDPYYGQLDDFEEVYQMVLSGVRRLLTV